LKTTFSVEGMSAEVQELYDATTVLVAALSFTYSTEDLLKPELYVAVERVIHARTALRRKGVVVHTDAALVSDRAEQVG
jgi:hypothetical protein